MKRKMKVILLLLMMTGIWTGCRGREDARLTDRAEDTVRTQDSSGDIGSDAEDPENPENPEDLENHKDLENPEDPEITETGTEADSAESIGAEAGATEKTDTDLETETGFVPDAADRFYHTALTEELKARITGCSYPDTEEPLQISYEDLSYVHVLHYDFEGQIQEGELICNQAVAQDLVEIFYELYESQYPIEKIRLIDEYSADDEASMADNNTSCFNYRTVPGSTKRSNHSYGFAIDINPLYNPYVRTRDGKELISPDNAVPYADRSADFPHKIDRNDLCYRIFIEHGFTWGGSWNSSKDYQHFEKRVQKY